MRDVVSILLRQQHRRDAPIRLRDDPHLGSVIQTVRRQEPQPVGHAELILLYIVGRQLAPVTLSTMQEKDMDNPSASGGPSVFLQYVCVERKSLASQARRGRE
jgi:hypothetical protein